MAAENIGGNLVAKMCICCLDRGKNTLCHLETGQWFDGGVIMATVVAVIPKVLFCPNCQIEAKATFAPKEGSIW